MKITRLIPFIILLLLLPFAASAQDFDPDLTGGEIQASIQEVVDNPADFMGQPVTIEGVVGEIVNVRGFTLIEDAAIAADGVLVINNTGQSWDLNLTRDSRVLVTGTVMEFTRDEVAYDPYYYEDYYDDLIVTDGTLLLYDRPFEEYADWTVIAVNTPGNVVPAVTLQTLAGGAEPYDDGRSYAIEGYVNEILGPNSIIIGEGATIANARVLVFGVDAYNMETGAVGVGDLVEGDRVRVYGTVSQYGDANFTEQYNEWGADRDLIYDSDFDADLYNGYGIDESWEAMFADLVVQIPPE